MSESLKLSIPKPCHENWNKMSPIEQGRFCGSCQTPVIDFTTWSDEQILGLFSNPSTGSVCGRFRAAQLTDVTSSAKTTKNLFLHHAAALLIPAMLLGTAADAQQKNTHPAEQISVYTADTLIKGKVMSGYDYIISGRITNEEGLPVAGAIVRIEGSVYGAVCSDEGYYSLRFRQHPGKIKVTAEAPGYQIEKKNVKLKKSGLQITEKNFLLKGDEVIIVGMVAPQ